MLRECTSVKRKKCPSGLGTITFSTKRPRGTQPRPSDGLTPLRSRSRHSHVVMCEEPSRITRRFKRPGCIPNGRRAAEPGRGRSKAPPERQACTSQRPADPASALGSVYERRVQVRSATARSERGRVPRPGAVLSRAWVTFRAKPHVLLI